MPLNGWLTALLGPQAILRRFLGVVHGRVVPLRNRAFHFDAGLLPRDPGHRRRRAAADRAGDSLRNVPAGEARRRDGDLRHGRDGRPGDRPDARRLHRRQRELAADLLHQHPDRNRRVPHDASVHSEPEVPAEAQRRHRLDRARAARRRASRRCSTCSSAASATTGSSRRRSNSLPPFRSISLDALHLQVATRQISDRRSRRLQISIVLDRFDSSASSWASACSARRSCLPLFFQSISELHGVRHRHGAAAGRALDRRLDAHRGTDFQPHRRPLVDRLRHARSSRCRPGCSGASPCRPATGRSSGRG